MFLFYKIHINCLIANMKLVVAGLCQCCCFSCQPVNHTKWGGHLVTCHSPPILTLNDSFKYPKSFVHTFSTSGGLALTVDISFRSNRSQLWTRRASGNLINGPLHDISVKTSFSSKYPVKFYLCPTSHTYVYKKSDRFKQEFDLYQYTTI